MVGYEAWISAIRRTNQRSRRGQPCPVGREVPAGEGQPLAGLDEEGRLDIHSDHDVPYNPLHDQGYPSIGCWPCTKPVGEGGDERDGRWAGTMKKECGLHVIEVQGGSGI